MFRVQSLACSCSDPHAVCYIFRTMKVRSGSHDKSSCLADMHVYMHGVYMYIYIYIYIYIHCVSLCVAIHTTILCILWVYVRVSSRICVRS